MAQRQKSSLQQLGFAVAALVMLLLVWNHLAEGAAGCFATMAGPVPDSGPAPDPSSAADDAGGHNDASVTPPPPLPGMIRLGQPPPKAEE
ncbi:MAG: hypothetical protein R3F39_01705 [Myxococcota bacterium]